MRTYGRKTVTENGCTFKKWFVIETTADGDDTMVWLTTLCQVLLLNLNESPFYADWGIPAKQSVLQQTAPDFWVALTQQRFAPYFATIIITKVNVPTPTYNVNIITKQGAKIDFSLGVPF
jgi:hypothetical protein